MGKCVTPLVPPIAAPVFPMLQCLSCGDGGMTEGRFASDSIDMDLLVFKLILTPTLIGLSSWAGRRWGPAVSGWLVGLPLTSGPVTFFVGLRQGIGFATATALGTLSSGLALAVFSLAYSWAARRVRWPLAVAVSLTVFGLTIALLRSVPLPPVGIIAFSVVAAFLIVLELMPRASALTAEPVVYPQWDIPLRMALATAFVVLITSGAPLLGSRLTGLLSTIPMYATLLAAFTHHQQGPNAVAHIMRGTVMGMFSFVGFYFVLGLTLEPLGLWGAFALAVVTALLTQGSSLMLMRRAGLPAP